MLKGNNVLELNASTVCAAVQEYFNRRITAKGDEVKIDSVSYGTGVYRFHTVEEKPRAAQTR
jgi:hypothetical protein